MKRHEIRLNNSPVTDIDTTLWVIDIEESTPEETQLTYDMGKFTRYLRTERKKLSVKATLMVRDRNQINRTEIYTRIQAWAKNGGYLTISDRPGKSLYCENVVLPTLGSILKWTNTFPITFVAYATPYWLDIPTSKVFATDDSATGTMRVIGNAEFAPVDAYVTAVGDVVNTLAITVGDTEIAFTGLSLAVGDTLAIVRADNGILTIKVGETSKMDKRTAESSDELSILLNATETVGFTANATCDVILKCRGRWL